MKDRLAVTNMPLAMAGGKGGQYRKPTMMWTLAQTSKVKDEAVKLINFFVRDLDAASLLGLERGIPSSAASREHITAGLTDLERQTLDFFANLGDLLGPIPPSPPSAAGEISQSLLGTLSQEIAFGAKSPEDGAAQLEMRAFVERHVDRHAAELAAGIEDVNGRRRARVEHDLHLSHRDRIGIRILHDHARDLLARRHDDPFGRGERPHAFERVEVAVFPRLVMPGGKFCEVSHK